MERASFFKPSSDEDETKTGSVFAPRLCPSPPKCGRRFGKPKTGTAAVEVGASCQCPQSGRFMEAARLLLHVCARRVAEGVDPYHAPTARFIVAAPAIGAASKKAGARQRRRSAPAKRGSGGSAVHRWGFPSGNRPPAALLSLRYVSHSLTLRCETIIQSTGSRERPVSQAGSQ